MSGLDIYREDVTTTYTKCSQEGAVPKHQLQKMGHDLATACPGLPAQLTLVLQATNTGVGRPGNEARSL